MKLNDVDLYDPGEVLSAIELLMEHYVKIWGKDDDFIKIVRLLESKVKTDE